MTIQVSVTRVESITDHPTKEHLSVVQLALPTGSRQVVTMKDEGGKFRFAQNELVIFVPENAIIRDSDLQERGFWDDDKGTGLLAGKCGNRVKASNFAGVRSEGLIWKLDYDHLVGYIARQDTRWQLVNEQSDLCSFFGITEYVAK